jgi:hypothetical protein
MKNISSRKCYSFSSTLVFFNLIRVFQIKKIFIANRAERNETMSGLGSLVDMIIQGAAIRLYCFRVKNTIITVFSEIFFLIVSIAKGYISWINQLEIYLISKRQIAGATE